VPPPNVVTIVLDDLGFAQLGSFGADLETPALDRLADQGLRYNRFHVTALCSPTRACLLTGRNHHAVGFGWLADVPMNSPGYTARLPRTAAPLPRLLRDAGYSTLAVGKWHLTPGPDRSRAGPFVQWPLGYGFERYYGFLHGDANHWTPNLVCDNQFVDPPRRPEDGYHLTEDLADTAIRYVVDQQQGAPGKPFFLYFALGAVHAPHHVTASWSDRYEGRFDDGWERWRERTFERQRTLGVVPEGTVLTPRPRWVQQWDELPALEQRLYARMYEVFGGFLTHADAQIGRLVAALERLGVLDDTLVMVISDNGASAEGGLVGTVNEHRFTLGLPESVDENLATLDEWGGHRAYNHYAWGWAWAGNTPLRLWKRYTWLGGTRTPLIVHWPRHVTDRGAVRPQFVHAIDLMPTILDAAGIAAPSEVDGVAQQAIDGASIRASFDDPGAPSSRDLQYFEMMGSRSIVHGRWKATTDHVSTGVVDEERLLEGSRSFDDDHWALFDLDQDFSEARDVAADHPEIVRELVDRWTAEAERNQVFPLVDSLIGRVGDMARTDHPPRSRAVFTPDGSAPCDISVPPLFGGFRLRVRVRVPPEGARGVLCAMGDWTGGIASYVVDGRLRLAINRAGDAVTVVGERQVPVGEHELGCEYVTAAGGPMIRLLHDDDEVGRAELAFELPFIWQHGGSRLRIGDDTGFPVCDDYATPFPWNGELFEVVVEVPEPRRARNEEKVRAALHAD
jgi:arylsulfatase